MGLETDAQAHLRQRDERKRQARARVALQLLCGIDLEQALALEPADRQRVALDLTRRLRRERLKGLNRHWSYDLNRHIALKEALDRIGERGLVP